MENVNKSKLKNKFTLLFVGFITGFLSGILGIGGGVIIIPLLTIYLKYEQKIAQGTSLATIFPISLFGAIGYLFNNSTEIKTIFNLGIGSMLGIYLGAILAYKLPPRFLSKAFSLLILVVGIKMLVG